MALYLTWLFLRISSYSSETYSYGGYIVLLSIYVTYHETPL